MSTTPHTPDSVLTDLAGRLPKILEEAPTVPIDRDTHLVRDLRLDSITSVELLGELEDHYHISIPLDDFATFETVGHVVDAVVKAAAGASR